MWAQLKKVLMYPIHNIESDQLQVNVHVATILLYFYIYDLSNACLQEEVHCS